MNYLTTNSKRLILKVHQENVKRIILHYRINILVNQLSVIRVALLFSEYANILYDSL